MHLSLLNRSARVALGATLAALFVAASCPAQAQDCRSVIIGYDPDPLVGSGSAPGQVLAPAGIVVEHTRGDFFVADSGNHRVQRFGAFGTFLTTFGSFGREPGQFDTPTDIAIGPDDLLYVADSGNDRIQVFTQDGAFVHSFGESGAGVGQLDEPWFLDVGDEVWVSDRGNRRVQVFTRQGVLVRVVGGSADGDNPFLEPSGVEIRPDGSVIVGDRLGGEVHILSTEGVLQESISLAGTSPLSVHNFSLMTDFAFQVADEGSGDVVTVFPPDVACPWAPQPREDPAGIYDFTDAGYCCYYALASDRLRNRISVYFFPDPVLPITWGGIKARAGQ